MPSSRKVKEKILAQIPKDTKGDIYELGCGWGTLLFPVAKAHPDSRVTGYEYALIPWLYTQVRQTFFPLKNITLHKADFLEQSLENADIVICYLYTGAMNALQSKFEQELKPGTLVISNTFSLPQWKAEKTIVLDDLYRTRIYVYRKESS